MIELILEDGVNILDNQINEEIVFDDIFENQYYGSMLAGEFLERLGKKKSIVVVEALNDYLLAHPELQEAHGRKIEVNVSGGYDRHKIEQIIRSIVEEKIAGLCVPDVLVANSQPIDSKATVSQKELPETMEDDIGQMLDNLDFFQ